MDGLLGFEDIEIGLALKPVVREITQENLNKYAEAINDFYPIYVNPDLAIVSPFSRVIADGAAPLAFISTLLNENFGATWTFCGSIKVSFMNPVTAGDTVFAKSTVLSKKIENDKKVVELSISCENQDGNVIAAGEATISF